MSPLAYAILSTAAVVIPTAIPVSMLGWFALKMVK